MEDEKELEDDSLLQKFLFKCMTNVIDFYHEIDEMTGKIKNQSVYTPPFFVNSEMTKIFDYRPMSTNPIELRLALF
jgi:hypothetical protein